MSLLAQAKTTGHQRQDQEKGLSPEAAPQRGPAGPHAGILALQRTAGNRAVSDLVASGAGHTAAGISGSPPVVHRALCSPGQPLDPATRAYFESRFDHSFADVRLHTDERAAASARDLHASAFTVGNNIAFAKGEYSHGSTTGRRLLAHELTHVIQQSGTGSAPGLGHEVDADRAAARVAAGQVAHVAASASPGLQRQEQEESLGTRLEQVAINKTMDLMGINRGTLIASAALTGMVTEVVEELGRGGKGRLFISRMMSISANDVPKLMGGYYLGLGEGLVSPITDLFGLAVFAEHLNVMAQDLLLTAITRRGELANDLQQLLPSIEGVRAAIPATLQGIRENPAKTILGLMTLADTISAQAPKMAFSLGKQGGAQIVKVLEEPWSPETKVETPSPSFLRQPLGWISSKAEKLEGKLLETPWSKIGNKFGYAVGFTVISVVLFAFTEGIGNAIVELGNVLGKVSKSLGALARGLESIAGVVKGVGAAVAEIERLIGVGIGKLLKPLESILEPIMKPFTSFLDKLKTFLRKLFGVVEKEAAPVVTAATTKGASSLAAEGPKPASKVAAPVIPKEAPSAIAQAPEAVLPHPPTTAKPPALEIAPTAHAPAGEVKTRRPQGFEPTSQGVKKRVKAGTMEGLEPTAQKPAPKPRKASVTREQQLEGIASKKEAHLAREEFEKVRDQWAKKLGVNKGEDVHHAIELNVLDRYPGVYTVDELNVLENMRGIPMEKGGAKQFHNRAIRDHWDRYYNKLDQEIIQRNLQRGTPEYNKFVRDYLEANKHTIDDVLWPFFNETTRNLIK